MLPEVDRNYAPTSAVAGGGIPQDVAPAWAHLRAVFAAAGAANVAWVWSPADPGADQPFTPPAAQIDAVAVTMYEYPGTAWSDPSAALGAAADSHPGKPLLVEVSAAGAGSIRSAWLEQLADEISARDDIAALVYSQAGPETDLTGIAAAPWAVTADPESVAAFQAAAYRIGAGGSS
jgi:hypothetical protein